MFEDRASYDPAKHGKVPLVRSPLALCLRGGIAIGSMILSGHPADALRWTKSMVARRWPLSYPIPWLTFNAIRALENKTLPGMRIFEFGSGHSTLYWANRGLEVHAVEDDEKWYDILQARFAHIQSVHVYLETSPSRYVSSISVVGGMFDIVVVDGSYRKSCLALAINHVKPGGFLVVDNTDWHWCADVDSQVPRSWVKQVYAGWAPFIGHQSETTLWIRPM